MILKKLLSIKKKINFFKKENNNSPFFYYTSNFDAETIIREFKKNNLEGEQGFITNYMGIKFPTKILSFFWTQNQDLLIIFPYLLIGTQI